MKNYHRQCYKNWNLWFRLWSQKLRQVKCWQWKIAGTSTAGREPKWPSFLCGKDLVFHVENIPKNRNTHKMFQAQYVAGILIHFILGMVIPPKWHPYNGSINHKSILFGLWPFANPKTFRHMQTLTFCIILVMIGQASRYQKEFRCKPHIWG